MSKGKINVHTENIFPIIKKFLYSDHEIFLRELVSNAVDATLKLKTLANTGEFKGETGDTTIDVRLDKNAKTITFSDRGVGMTADEVDKYINQIAFSGAEEFVARYKDKMDSQNIIGHFGLGFYSSFMVASKVEIVTRSWKEEDPAKAVRWECDGSPEFELGDASRSERGTDIILHINEESLEFLESPRISTLLDKYCKFLPVEIRFEDKTINNTKPAWVKKPSDLKDDDYKSFYKELYPFSDDPLFHIHLNVDYPFNLTGILYFPKFNPNMELQKNKIRLYSNQVFVTDAVEGIVPDFLTLLHGVIDSPDIPLNVSRSYLQSDSNVKKISSHITKKVADRLEEIFKENRNEFEEKWDDISVFIKYGMLSDEKFHDRAEKFCLLKSESGKYFTIEEYKKLIEPTQTNKDKKTVCLYASDKESQFQFIETAKNEGYDVLIMNDPLDSHFVNMIESRNDALTFARVDSDVISKLIEKEGVEEPEISEENKKLLTGMIEQITGEDKDKYELHFQAGAPGNLPVSITRPEFMRRMKEMSAAGGGMFGGQMPEKFTVSVNTNHPLIQSLILSADSPGAGEKLKYSFDLALLSQNMLKGQELSSFIQKSISLAQEK
jgi:molecular chaperone HtpG